MDFCSGDSGTSGSYMWVGGLSWTGIWDFGGKMWFLLALRKGCRLLMPPTKCLSHMQQPPLVNGRYRDINCSRMGRFGFGCPALGCSPLVGLLLRWSHSCLFVECPYFVPRLSSCPQRPLSRSLLLSPLLPAFIPVFTSPQAPLHLRKSDTFCEFSSWFFPLCSDIVQECMMGNWEGNLFLPQFNFIILWTNSSRGLGKRGRDGGAKERTGAPTV